MKAKNQPPIDINFEDEINDRINAIINKKLEENRLTVERLGATVTNWKKIRSKLDSKMNAESNLLKAEKKEIENTEKLLKRNICDGVDKKSFGIAGKIIDHDTRLSLPGMLIRIAPKGKKNIVTEVKSDKFGNFTIEKEVNELIKKMGGSKELTFTVVSPSKRIIHKKDVKIQPKKGEMKKDISLEVKCTGKLSEIVNTANTVKESIERDKELLESRIKKTAETHGNFRNLAKVTNKFIRGIRRDITVSPPKVESIAKLNVATIGKGARFLGNSNTLELHDLHNKTINCQIDKIKPRHRVIFANENDAILQNYGNCAYCIGK
jgi:hypothetical protein